MPPSEGEVPESEPQDQGGSQHDQLLFELNPEEIAEVVILDDEDIDLMLKVPQAASTPVSEPAPPQEVKPRRPGFMLIAFQEMGNKRGRDEHALPGGSLA